MPLVVDDKWVWDPWLAKEDGDWHVFYLQAPKSIGSADQRHWHVSIGHAVSQDLAHWEILPDALSPSEDDPQAWDSYTTWTGSLLQRDGLWHLFYTGGSRAEEGRVQRIGLATSEDLLHWEKYGGNPVLSGEGSTYEQLNLDEWHEQAWRDPWLFYEPEERAYYALITARVAYGPPDGRGVIAHARSPDLIDWQVLPPLTEPGAFGHMEVPQLVTAGAARYLLFGVVKELWSHAAAEGENQRPHTGIYYLKGDAENGSFDAAEPRLLLGDSQETFYAGKLLETAEGTMAYLPALYRKPDGDFVGALGDPLPITLDPDGELTVDVPSPGST